MATGTPLTWSVVIPVKLLTRAKSRLSGLTDTDRQALVLAMAADTVAAAIACTSVGAVVVVTDDPDVRAEAAGLGAVVTAERRDGAERQNGKTGLNLALSAGAAYAASRWAGRGLAALTADLPAMAARELGTALTAAAAQAQAFVPDAAGSGTTLYAAGPGVAFRPRFGPSSRELHREAGATELDILGICGLRQDVDTLADLRAAARIGLGPRSAAAWEALPAAGAGSAR